VSGSLGIESPVRRVSTFPEVWKRECLSHRRRARPRLKESANSGRGMPEEDIGLWRVDERRELCVSMKG